RGLVIDRPIQRDREFDVDTPLEVEPEADVLLERKPRRQRIGTRPGRREQADAQQEPDQQRDGPPLETAIHDVSPSRALRRYASLLLAVAGALGSSQRPSTYERGTRIRTFSWISSTRTPLSATPVILPIIPPRVITSSPLPSFCSIA